MGVGGSFAAPPLPHAGQARPHPAVRLIESRTNDQTRISGQIEVRIGQRNEVAPQQAAPDLASIASRSQTAVRTGATVLDLAAPAAFLALPEAANRAPKCRVKSSAMRSMPIPLMCGGSDRLVFRRGGGFFHFRVRGDNDRRNRLIVFPSHGE